MAKLPTMKERCQSLIASPSVSATLDHLDQSNHGVIELLYAWFSDLGFSCEVIAVGPGKSNLIASIGSGPGGLVLSGHTDTVPCDRALWQSDPFVLREDQDRWYGLGIIDMKGFFSTVIEVLTDLDLTKLKRPLVIVATCDEESSMAGARKLIELNRRLGKMTVIGEPTGLKPIRAHKGIMMERLELHGQSGHSSDPKLGRNALDAMTECLVALKTTRSTWAEQYHHDAFSISYPTLNLGCIHGGDNPNRICGQCTLDFDVRTIPGLSPEHIRSTILSAIQPICDQHGVAFDFGPLIEALPSFEESPDASLLKTLEQLTNTSAESVAFGTEAPYFKALSDEVVVLG
ncbi:MAG: acetylornithine deacetylase, partial [Bradymonadia bacterium]